ncbi:MauE/DoxX family redox-associated membrane protein [Rheinheimera hassiensis]|uniref:MauE/DoxX family redox-associated membrane protein n=1 Tax=Rheinheimera hassiensis TaxID=1193627 RepID=UPI001F060240|nr:MauE/DoxX family redox-associated membrane protein [Rheinheimera hassiensis]
MELLLSICRYSTALLFLLAAISKILKFKSFRRNLSESFNIPNSLSTLCALVIAVIELSLALWLLTLSGSAKFAMLLALLLMVVFSMVLAAIYWLKGPLRCNCFGEQHRTFSVADLARNLLIMCGISLYLIAPEVQFQPVMFMPLLAVALALTLVLIHLHETIELLSVRSEYD